MNGIKDFVIPEFLANEPSDLEQWVEGLDIDRLLVFLGWCAYATDLTRAQISKWDQATDRWKDDE